MGRSYISIGEYNIYRENFSGSSPYPEHDLFNSLAAAASDIIYGICVLKPSDEDVKSDTFKRAVAYQIETLLKQGGSDAVAGLPARAIASESLGDYSVSYVKSADASNALTFNGIPVSPISVMLLREMGLMSRWAYAKR